MSKDYEQFYAESIVETVREPLIILDNELRVKQANPSFYKTFEVKSEDTINKPVYELGNGQWNIPSLINLLQDIADNDSTFNDFEVTHSFPHLGRRTMLLNARKIIHDSDTLPLILLAIEDITEKVKAREELNRYINELKRSNEELEQFASVASHDLQEPLRKVIMFGERLRSSYGKNIPDEGLNYLERMQNASRRMQKLINGLLTLSRITTRGKDFAPVDLNLTVKQVITDLEATILEKNGKVETRPLPTIMADELQLTLLFQNLISNSLKYHRESVAPEIKIFEDHKSTGKEPEASDNKDFYIITVEDNGIGFDESYLEKIFLPFQRLHERGKFEGTGIGLTICKKIMERHGGSITATSKIGEGSRFILKFPEINIME